MCIQIAPGQTSAIRLNQYKSVLNIADPEAVCCLCYPGLWFSSRHWMETDLHRVLFTALDGGQVRKCSIFPQSFPPPLHPSFTSPIRSSSFSGKRGIQIQFMAEIQVKEGLVVIGENVRMAKLYYILFSIYSFLNG